MVGISALLYGILSGLLMGLTLLIADLAPLQVPALALLFYGLRQHSKKLKSYLLCGIWFAIALLGLTLLVVKIPGPAAAILFIYIGSIYVTTIAGVAYLYRRNVRYLPLAVAALFVLTEALNISALSLFGTGQLFARPWSSWPSVIQFSSITGMLGITFMVVFFASWLVQLTEQPHRKQMLSLGIIVLTILIGLNFFGKPESAESAVRVAAIGGNPFDFNGSIPEDMILEAADKGAEVVVAPELGISIVNEWDAEKSFETLQNLAKDNQIALVIGYIDRRTNSNRAVFIEPTGHMHEPYDKTHLVPVIEDYDTPGGNLITAKYKTHTIGIMICQDDNMTDLSRAYDQLGVEIMFVPTFDWPGVDKAHFSNSIHRAIETHYSIVRAAIGGVSAVIASDGKILDAMNHLEAGPGIVITDLPVIQSSVAPFSRYGNIPIVLLALTILIAALASPSKPMI